MIKMITNWSIFRVEYLKKSKNYSIYIILDLSLHILFRSIRNMMNKRIIFWDKTRSKNKKNYYFTLNNVEKKSCKLVKLCF